MSRKLTDYLTNAPILLNVDISDKDQLIGLVFQQVSEKGWVTNNFKEKVLAREKEFPTGIFQGRFGVAIPHTDPDCVNKEFVSLVIPRKAVSFQRMDDPNESVEIKFIFILGLNQPHEQLEMLQQLMTIIQDNQLLEKLSDQKEEKHILEILGKAGY